MSLKEKTKNEIKKKFKKIVFKIIKPFIPFLIVIFLIALILDQISKIIAYKNGWNISSEASNNGYNIVITLIIVLMLIRYISNDNTFIKLDTKIILTLAISGAIGNLIDRIWNQNVIIFIVLIKK